MFGNSENDAAFRGAVELAERNTGQADGGVELLCLVERVLAGAGIHYQHDFVRRVGIQFAQYPLDFYQFFHQIGLGMQAPGSIGDQHIDVACLRRLQGIKNDRGGIGTLLLRDYRNLVAFTPGL